MLQILYEADGRQQVFNLVKEEATIGRAMDNDIVLSDFSVSRRHAYLKKEGGGWVLYDNKSTNGVRVNDLAVPQSPVRAGDSALIGTFLLRFQEAAEVAPIRGERGLDSTATCIRPISEFNRDFGLEKDPRSGPESTDHKKRAVLDIAYKNRVFEMLVQVAKTLISADDLETVLQKVMDMIFEYLPVDRAFLLLEEGGALKLRVSRVKSSRRVTLDGAPYSRTIADMVVRDKVAVLTSDAQADERFGAGQSIRIQQIRSAMCAPLWSGGDSVIGVIHVDSPLHVGNFTEQDLDLLTALANFAAVAIERARLHERVAEEERIRGRLQRYHSPQIIEVIIADAKATGSLKTVRTETVTILFADLVGFTSWSERMPAGELAELLTRFFTLASEAIFSEEGTIDKFVGDAVMAFFGAPIDQPDHAVRAVSAAVKIREGMSAWNRQRQGDGKGALEVRIAVNTGEAIVGDIGSERRVDYTVLGNAVNAAARMEEFVATPGDIVIGPETYQAVRKRFRVAQLGFFVLKGLSTQVPLYKVLSDLDAEEIVGASTRSVQPEV